MSVKLGNECLVCSLDKGSLVFKFSGKIKSRRCSRVAVKNKIINMEYLQANSGGNDSVALMQLMHDKNLSFGSVYNNTGWARSDWAERVKEIARWCFSREIPFFETKSEGMEALVRRKKGWPMPASAMQFCTSELKEKPTLELLDRIDPNLELIIVTGRRREESQNRRDLAQYQDESKKHGGRDVWNPLYLHDEAMRDALIKATGFKPLPHSSMECYPCVCANKTDLGCMAKDDPRINEIEIIEIEMGFTRNEKPRTMFRPYRVGGGVGVRMAIEWGHGKRGFKAPYIPDAYTFKGEATEAESDVAYDESTKEGLEFSRQCDGGYCGN